MQCVLLCIFQKIEKTLNFVGLKSINTEPSAPMAATWKMMAIFKIHKDGHCLFSGFPEEMSVVLNKLKG